MRLSSHRIFIGSAGWQHAAWQGEYYPDDLPQDWRLGYYANEFPMVLLTEADRQALDDIASLPEECREGFMFVIEADLTASALDVEQAVSLLQERDTDARTLHAHCAGLLVVVSEAQLQDQQFIPEIFQRVDLMSACCIDTRGQPLPEALQSWRLDRQLACCWQDGLPKDILQSGAWSMLVVPPHTDLRQLRQYVETALSVSSPQRDVFVLFRGNPPAIELMRQAQTIEQLL